MTQLNGQQRHIPCRNYSAHPFAYLNRSTPILNPFCAVPKARVVRLVPPLSMPSAPAQLFYSTKLVGKQSPTKLRTTFNLFFSLSTIVTAFTLRQTHPRSTPDRLPECARVLFLYFKVWIIKRWYLLLWSINSAPSTEHWNDEPNASSAK